MRTFFHATAMRSNAALALLALFSATWAPPVLAQSKVYQASYTGTRNSAFEYDASTGLLTKEVIEPGTAAPDLCVQTVHQYDAYGNRTTSTTSPCPGASAQAQFAPRGTTTNASVLAPAGSGISQGPGVVPGAFPITQTNALGHAEYRKYDPKNGQALQLVGPNGLSTTWAYDGFGRKISETRADGSVTRVWYCLIDPAGTDVATFGGNTVHTSQGNCATMATGLSGTGTPGQVAHATALSHYIHTQAYLPSGLVAGPYVRTFYDQRGREVRSVTQAFDGGASLGKLVVKDTYYHVSGATAAVTQPYFWDTKRSVLQTSATQAGYGYTYTEYDVLGRPKVVYTANEQASNAGDLVDMPATRPAGLPAGKATKVEYTYDGLSVTTTVMVNGVARATKTESNPDGKAVRTTDALGAQQVFQYDEQGNLRRTFDAMGTADGGYGDANVIVVELDARGRKTAMLDPNKGAWTYTYNALGELLSQTNSRQQTTRYTYDVLGRLLTTDAPDHFSRSTYDTLPGGASCSGASTSRGLLCATTTQRDGAGLANAIAATFQYDALLRPTGSTRLVYSASGAVERRFVNGLSYDAEGRAKAQVYPTGLRVVREFSTLGFVNKVGEGAGNTVTTTRWQAGAVNAWGKAESYTLGNGVIQRSGYDPQTGSMLAAGAGTGAANNVFDQVYRWDSVGNLSSRTDAFGSGGSQTLDTFQYDALNRLTQYQVSAPPSTLYTVNLRYNAVGNILSRSDVGYYQYAPSGAANPHAAYAVRGAVNADYHYGTGGNLDWASAGPYQRVTYTSFNQPDSTDGILGRDGTRYTYVYDEARQRFLERRTQSSGALRGTFKLHPDNANGLGFEQEREGGSVTNRHYVSVGGLVVAMVQTSGEIYAAGQEAAGSPQASAAAVVRVEYWHQDRLGSLVALTDAAGAVRARYAYDPWGRRRNPDGSFTALAPGDYPNGTDRGFTGHEHLDDVGIVHMNGRLYDPVLARFMQADPVVGDPLDMQTYNGFSYVYNRPLVLTDATGNCPWCLPVLAVIVGARVAGVIDQKTFRSLMSMYVAAALGPAGWGQALGLQGVGGAAIAGFASGVISGGSIEGGFQSMFTSMMFYGVGSMADQLGSTTVMVDGASFVEAGSSADAIWGSSGFGRAALHAAAGCVTSSVSGASCKDGARGSAAGVLLGGIAKSDSVAAGVVTHALIGGTVSMIGGGKFANGAKASAFGYLFNQCAHGGCGGRTGEGGVRSGRSFLEGVWDDAMAKLFPPPPDAIQLEFSAYVVSGNLILSRDLELFGSWGVAKGYPFSYDLGGSLTAQYIDGGRTLGASARSDIIGGPSVGVAACVAIVCVGRQWSPTAQGPVGTTSVGFGTPGVSGTVGNSTPLGNLSTRKCTAPFRC